MPHVSVDASPASLSPMALFLHADLVVKLVMLGLLLASCWSWSIIIQARRRLARERAAADRFAVDFPKEELLAAPTASFAYGHVAAAGIAEWNECEDLEGAEGLRDRLSAALASAVAEQVERISDSLNVLATIGAVAPFVGLFGTVWGIMSAFTSIASSQNTNLTAVAPGIAEALAATALGLFAAIPAVVAYNRLSHAVNKVEAILLRIADRLHAQYSRQIDRSQKALRAPEGNVVSLRPVRSETRSPEEVR